MKVLNKLSRLYKLLTLPQSKVFYFLCLNNNEAY